MSLTRLTSEQEAEAKHLEVKIVAAIANEVADLARLLVSKDDKDLFGATEFQVRDLVLRMGAKAYSEHLREKKTATAAPPSIVLTVAKEPGSRTFVRSSP
jgi:hypothetical protein